MSSLFGFFGGFVAFPILVVLFVVVLDVRERVASGALAPETLFWFLRAELRGRPTWMHLARINGHELARSELWSLFPEETNAALLYRRALVRRRGSLLPLGLSPRRWKIAGKQVFGLSARTSFPPVPLDPDRQRWVDEARERSHRAFVLRAFPNDEEGVCPRCRHLVRKEGGQFVAHDLEGLEPNTPDYWTGAETGIGHTQCRDLPAYRPR